MKKTEIVSVFVLCCSLISSAISLKPLHGLSGPVGEVVGFAHHSVLKRQTVSDLTTQDIIDCTSRAVEHQCSSDYAQGVANIALGCSNQTLASNTANACARSEGGQRCGVAFLQFVLDPSTNATTCDGAVASGVCPPTCRNFLESGRSRLGCCINTYINTTDSPLFVQYNTYVDYRLWNLCNVALPAADCGNSPVTLRPPSDAQTCNPTELFSRIVQFECMTSVGQPLVNALLSNRRCYVFAKLGVDYCASNANGQFCANVIGMDLLSSARSNPLLVSLTTNCVSKSTCSSSCRSTVTNIARTYGCCVNIYNNSDIGLQFPSLSYSVWNSCGVNSPGFCKSTLKSTLSGSGTIQAFAWVTFVAIAIASYMN